MICIFRAYNVVDAYIVKDLLVQKGIEAVVFYDHVGGLGLAPYMQAGVWLKDEHDKEFSLQMIAEYERRKITGVGSIDCDGCGEVNPNSFECCWSCGEELRESPTQADRRAL